MYLKAADPVFPLSTSTRSNVRGNCWPRHFYLGCISICPVTHAQSWSTHFSPLPTTITPARHELLTRADYYISLISPRFPEFICSLDHLSSSLHSNRNTFKLCNEWSSGKRSPGTPTLLDRTVAFNVSHLTVPFKARAYVKCSFTRKYVHIFWGIQRLVYHGRPSTLPGGIP